MRRDARLEEFLSRGLLSFLWGDASYSLVEFCFMRGCFFLQWRCVFVSFVVGISRGESVPKTLVRLSCMVATRSDRARSFGFILMGSDLCTGADPSPRSQDALRWKVPNAHLLRGKGLPRLTSPRFTAKEKLVHYNAWGCHDRAVPQEALDVTVRTRDSRRHGAESRASSGA